MLRNDMSHCVYEPRTNRVELYKERLLPTRSVTQSQPLILKPLLLLAHPLSAETNSSPRAPPATAVIPYEQPSQCASSSTCTNLGSMETPADPKVNKLQRRLHSLAQWVRSGWLVGLLSTAIILSGALNVLTGLRFSLPQLGRLSQLEDPLPAVGATGEVILGAVLVLIGVGLWWRLRSMWLFAMLVLSLTVAAEAVLRHWGIELVLPLAVLVCLLLARASFARNTRFAGSLLSLVCVIGTVAYGVIGSYILGTGFKPHIGDLSTAWYFTLVSLSTVGYGDIVAVSAEARIFVMTLLVVGIGVFATALASTLGPFVSGELSRLLGVRKEKVNLSGHIILVGDGLFARVTGLELARRKAVFVQLLGPTTEPITPEQLFERTDPDEETGLRRAGVERAKTVIAAHDDDGRNAFSILLVKNIDPRIKVIALAGSRKSIRPLELAAADIVFAPVLAGGRLLADLAQGVEIPQEFRDLLQRKQPPSG